MYTLFKRPDKLSKGELDAFLALGWYRMGQYVFTTHFLHVDEEEYPTIWIRLNLKEHQLKKSQRKIINRVENTFITKIQPSVLNSEKEFLFQKYRKRFKEDFSRSLEDYLFNGFHFKNIFDSWEVCVYNKQELIAVSIFDLGKKSAASISSPFDPEYSKYSFGIYTLLKEIEYCKKIGLEYYYPGYITMGYSAFDYKLRIGEVEYFDILESKWLPWSAFQYKEDIATYSKLAKLKILREWLSKNLQDGSF